MLIRSVHLENIRSYADADIEFPEGSVLLSGDVGAGKSTILLSIEFALFGIKKPGLSGNALLRKGTRTGYVELRMKLGSKDILIKRTLVRQKNDVRQDSGYIIIDGVKTEATPIELKSKILDLLGYPKALLRKQKEIIFRYTVYTPQEEMKAILFEDSESRLNTLRKAFGLDTYRRIRENCLIYVRQLKEKKRYLSGQILDLTEKKQALARSIEGIRKTHDEFMSLQPEMLKIKEKMSVCKKEISRQEEQIRKGQSAQKKNEMLDIRLRSAIDERKSNAILIKQLREEIGQQITSEMIDHSYALDFLEDEIKKHEKDMQRISMKQNEIKIMLKNSTETKKKIISLARCPLCEQDVSEKHKKGIMDREDDKQDSLNKQKKEIESWLRTSEQNLSMIKADHEAIRKMQSEQELLRYKIKIQLEKKKHHDSLVERNNMLKTKIGKINQEKILLRDKLLRRETEEKHKVLLDDMQKLMIAEREIDLEIARLENQMDAYAKNASDLLLEVGEKEKIKTTIQSISKLQNWLEEFFMRLTTVIEKHILSRVYGEFNERFVSTFDMLMDDENISVRLDDEFTPIIQQSGYDIELDHLSGGEKTSVALSYRIALNYVINDLVSNIRTKDIIILDEPTDGFSDGQFDKVRDVLDKLHIRQIIIVSHESKIESFVDNVISIKKNTNLSSVS